MILKTEEIVNLFEQFERKVEKRLKSEKRKSYSTKSKKENMKVTKYENTMISIIPCKYCFGPHRGTVMNEWIAKETVMFIRNIAEETATKELFLSERTTIYCPSGQYLFVRGIDAQFGRLYNVTYGENATFGEIIKT